MSATAFDTLAAVQNLEAVVIGGGSSPVSPASSCFDPCHTLIKGTLDD